MRSIQTIIDEVMAREGGFVALTDDAGGPTNLGITLMTLSQFRGRVCSIADLRALTMEEARRIYLQRYVQAPGFDLLETLDADVAAELVDTGVNMGVETAAKFFQRCLNALNRQQELYPDLKADGHLGPVSRAAFATFLKVRGALGKRAMLLALNCLQGARYVELTELREKNESFLLGWLLNRVSL